MAGRSGRVVTSLVALVALVMMPATATADCNGPGCDPAPVVEGTAIAVTLALLLVFVGVMAVAEFRQR